MNIEVTKVERIKEATLPPGEYKGVYSGYVIKLKFDNGHFVLHTKDGICRMSDCIVFVDSTGLISVKIIQPGGSR